MQQWQVQLYETCVISLYGYTEQHYKVDLLLCYEKSRGKGVVCVEAVKTICLAAIRKGKYQCCLYACISVYIHSDRLLKMNNTQ